MDVLLPVAMHEITPYSDVVEIARRLIAVNSVNPRLAPAGETAAGEADVTAWLCEFCSAAGWRWALQAVHPGRSNFIALVPGSGQRMLWEAHQDTVSVQGMTISPLASEVRGGRLYGRGACDVKGPMAAMLAALRRTAASPSGGRPSILFAATVNEECGFTGARALADIWREAAPREDVAPPAVDPAGGLTLEELQAVRPAAALIAEPTDLDVVVAHRGVVRWRLMVRGRAAHSSRPDRGLNAVYAMAEVVREIDRYHRQVLAMRAADPQCGPPTVSVTTIAGGLGPNTVPDYAVIDVDRRLTPAEDPAAAYGELVDHLAASVELGGCTLEHEAAWMQNRGLASHNNLAWAERVAGAARAVGVRGALKGVPYGTNAASIAAAGIPAVVFGPGSIDQAHTADEWIAVDELALAVEVLEALAAAGVPESPHR
jgi:acetylornithine deacetylase